MTPGPGAPAVLRRLARMLVRGREAPYVLTDLDDAFEHDLARGLSPARADRRYAVNAVASAANLWRARLHPAGLRPSWIDVKLGCRMLVKYPGLTLVALFALALGIPIGLAPMHAVDTIEATLPEDPGGRIRMLRYWNAGIQTPTTFDDVARWRASLTSVDAIGASRSGSYNVEIAGAVVPVQGAEVTASTFDILGVTPLLGRALTVADETPGGRAVVVIGHELWQARLGGRGDLIGEDIRIGGVPHEIIGIMPPAFRFPSHQELWLPMRDRPAPASGTGRPLTVFARLAAGRSPDDAQMEMRVVESARTDRAPGTAEPPNPEVVPTSFMTFHFPKGGIRALPEFALVQILTLVPLLIACVNVGLLTFARTATRSMEFAMRTALGASRARIVAQVFTEAFVLSLLAAGAGLLLLQVVPPRVLPAIGVPMPYWLEPALSVATLLRALGLAMASAFIAGVIPVLRATGPRVHQTIQRARSRRSGARFGGVATVMIVADVAVAVAAVGFAIGVFSRVTATFANEKADGIRAERFLAWTLTVDAAGADGGFAAAHRAIVQQTLEERLRAEPGVRAVVAATSLPRMDHQTRFVDVDGDAPPPPDARGHRVRMAGVGDGFFEALRTPLLSGRAFEPADLALASSPVIVNRAFVDNVLGGRAAVGRRVRYRIEGSEARGPWHEIVGVVGHLGMHSLAPAEDDGVYYPLAPGSAESVAMAVETDGDPAALAPRVREIARAVDPRAAVISPTRLDRVFEGDWYLMAAVVVGGLVLVGVLLTLAASGLYAIMSFAVAARTREIGIRVALGADRLRIALHVARRALMQIAAGVVLGLPVATAVFFEVQQDAGRTPSALIAVLWALVPGVAVMAVVGAAACLVPTVRALRISPVEALRGDG